MADAGEGGVCPPACTSGQALVSDMAALVHTRAANMKGLTVGLFDVPFEEQHWHRAVIGPRRWRLLWCDGGGVEGPLSHSPAPQDAAEKELAAARAAAQKEIAAAKAELNKERDARLGAEKKKIDAALEKDLAALAAEKEKTFSNLDSQVRWRGALQEGEGHALEGGRGPPRARAWQLSRP